MKKQTKVYVDQQIQWVRTLKQEENKWLQLYLESELRSDREKAEAATRHTEMRTTDYLEWRSRIEKTVSEAVPRREMRGLVITVITLMISFLALLVMIFLKK